MDMLSALTGAGGVDAVARETGVEPEVAKTGLEALLPAVLGGMQNHAQANPDGLGGLAGMLGGLGGGGLFDNAVSDQPTDVSKGNSVLGELFGSKDGSRAVAADAAQKSGLSPELLKKMLPIVAMLAAGYFARRAGQQQGGAGGLGGMLGSLLGGGNAGASNPLGSILAGLTGR